jgi:hypothetical protein
MESTVLAKARSKENTKNSTVLVASSRRAPSFTFIIAAMAIYKSIHTEK